jgi:methylmalonyl-CoA epimerase
MKATLDHIGIAVADLEPALRFFRDVLGLEVEPPEEVASQHVRAHFLDAGETKLELLESTSPDSPIARFLARRGPGLHHITLRVADVAAALAELKARGIRLVDEQPRLGAEGALVAFIHPSAAHGVLVELKQVAGSGGRPSDHGQSATAAPRSAIRRFALGEFELTVLFDGFFRLDGGAMFGVVPKPLWETKARPDDRNRILLAMRPLLVRGARTMIIDAGLGDKENDKFHEIYGVDRTRHLDHALVEAGLAIDDIDIVLASHLHFDHAGGFTVRDPSGRVRPRFPRAQYVVRRGEWEDAMHPNPRTRASYLRDNFAPLADAGVLQLVDDDRTIMPGVRVQRTGGHTPHHQIVWLESGGKSAAFVADLIPTIAHVPDPWIMGYDLNPLDTLRAKQQFARDAIARQTLVVFEHDPHVVAGYLGDANGKRKATEVL